MSKAEQVSNSSQMSEMQRELLNRADSIMLWIQESVTKAGQFAAEHIPDIAMQYVAYGRAMSTFYILASLVMLGMGLWLVIKGFRRVCADEIEGIPITIAGILMALFSAVSINKTVGDFLMVWFAPKVWLLKEVVNLVK